MAAKTKTTTEASTVFETATKAFEEITETMQEQYLSMLKQGQTAALEGYQTFVDAVGKIEIPGVDMPDVEAMKIPVDAFDGFFDFTAKMLKNQRDFAHKMLAVSAKA